MRGVAALKTRTYLDPWKDSKANADNGSDGERHVRGISEAMVQDAYKSHVAHLRFPPKEQSKAKDRANAGKKPRADKLHKIRSFITEVLSNIEAGWTCYQELTVDEAMIRVKSKRCTFIQYMPVSAQITTYFFPKNMKPTLRKVMLIT